ncbi:Lysophospholipase 1 [Cryptotrichosporon argae]
MLALALVPLLAALPLALAAALSPADRRALALELVAHARRTGQDPRALAARLIGGGSDYAPYAVDCPSDLTWVRSAVQGLGSGEQAFLEQRRSVISGALQTQYAAFNITAPPRDPVLAVALSGGGYRAMINGLGMAMGLMNASSESAAALTGGWFDGMTYMAGLSGGSWATGSFFANGGPLPTELVENVWELDENLVVPSDDTISFYYDLVSEVDAKSDLNFPTQITDYWALALGNHLLPTQYRLDTSPNFTIAQLPDLVPAYANASLPMPIIIAAEREAGEIIIAENSSVWEFTPYEFGSWAWGSQTKVPGAFTSVEFLGTAVNNGQPNGTCYKGFDQLSFVMGTSSTLFNSALISLVESDDDSIITDALEAILTEIGEDENDVSRIPNTFYGWTNQTNPISTFEYVTLIDAGETNQNIPIEPLLVPARAVDAILAFDNTADNDYSWPNGSSLYTTYSRAQLLAENQNVSIRMPAVPSENGFVNGGYNSRPTFFGCNDTTTPLIVYVPNYPWSAYTNTSTYMLEYDNATALANMESAMRALTLNGTVATWPTCLACALTDRANGFTAANRTATCQSCFDTWCWAGDDNTTTPSTIYAPTVGTAPSFLTQRNLTSGATTAAGASTTTATVTASASAAASSSATANSTSGAGRTVGLGGAAAAIAAGVLTGVMALL